MRIAFVTDEFPPDTPGGGIATYLVHAAAMLSERGEDVEIFARSNQRSGCEIRGRYRINWIETGETSSFRERVVRAFAERHSEAPFDVVEGTDYNASALDIHRAFPRLPYVVKLHTPNFLVDELHRDIPPLSTRIRMHIGSLRRGRIYRPTDFLSSEGAKREVAGILEADEIASPSQAVEDKISEKINLNRSIVSVFPYCFEPSTEFLEIEPGGGDDAIIFFGRLEVRKGVFDLAKAFVEVSRKHPHARLKLVGRPMPIPRSRNGRTTADEILSIVGAHSTNVEFLGVRDRAEIPALLATAGIAVFPSHWESFGLVCCEAMAAARAVVGSSAGGMTEILDGGSVGRLAAPMGSKELAAILVELLDAQAERRRLGVLARRRVIEFTSYEAVYPAQRASYERAIQRSRTKPRPSIASTGSFQEGSTHEFEGAAQP